jgi:ketosteroid isomerase-like protein
MSQENVELVRGLLLGPDVDFAPLFRHDDTWEALIAGVAALIHPDFECASTVLGIERKYAGVEGFRAFWLDWLAPWESYRTETEGITDLGDQVLQFVIEFGRLPGATAEVRGDNASVWTFRDGKIIRFHGYADRAEALEAMGLAE